MSSTVEVAPNIHLVRFPNDYIYSTHPQAILQKWAGEWHWVWGSSEAGKEDTFDAALDALRAAVKENKDG